MELDGRRGVGGARAQHDSRPLRYSLQHLSQPSTIDLNEDGENGLPFEFRDPNEQGPGSYCEGEGGVLGCKYIAS